MGLFDKLASMLKVRKEQVNILVVGLNNSGKSTIVNHFKLPEEKSSIIVPTVGFNVERFQSESWKLSLLHYLGIQVPYLLVHYRSRHPVHSLRHVRRRQVSELVGASLQEVPRDRLCH